VDASVGLAGSGTSLNALSGTAWNVYDSIPGWTTVSGSGIEVQRGTVIAPHSGAFYVELDSHPNATNSGSTNTRMSQNLGALALGVYDLSFYYSPRTSNATSMDIAFDLAGGAAFSDTVGFVDGAVGSWTLITRSFAVTSGADVVLSFAAGARRIDLAASSMMCRSPGRRRSRFRPPAGCWRPGWPRSASHVGADASRLWRRARPGCIEGGRSQRSGR
jgi:hypothetical protein